MMTWKIWDTLFKVQPGVKPEQAWTPTEKEHTTINPATMLGAIGELSSNRVDVLQSFHSEKKLMPMIVLTASIIYVGIAATFYFDVI